MLRKWAKAPVSSSLETSCQASANRSSGGSGGGGDHDHDPIGSTAAAEELVARSASRCSCRYRAIIFSLATALRLIFFYLCFCPAVLKRPVGGGGADKGKILKR